MEHQYINVQDILIDESRFSLRDYIFESWNAPTCHITSFDSLGILYPIIVYQDSRNTYHLVDGRKRLQFARETKSRRINANILSERTPVREILTLIFCNKRVDIESSVINKVAFLNYALVLKAGEQWILQTLCVPFEMKPHRNFLRECERIHCLPSDLKAFCHEKKFSLKQVLNLTYFPEEILKLIMSWKPSLQLTASIMDEIASNLRDYLRREGQTAADFASSPEVQEIFDSSMSAREKTGQIRRILRSKRYPILSAKNGAIEDLINSLNLPAGIEIHWDRTLETRELHITAMFSDEANVQTVMARLNSRDIQDVICRIIDEL